MVFAVVFFCLSFVFLDKGLTNYTRETIKYHEIDDVNYKVHLKENDFFEVEYLPEDQIYITSLIDTINVRFNHVVKYDKNVSGKYKYYVKGIISATQESNSNNSFWQKEFELTEPKTLSYDNVSKNEVKENVEVDYQYFNDLLLEFKKTYNLSMDGTLKVILYVENEIESDSAKKNIVKDSVLCLTIPLTKATIEVPIKIDTTSAESTLSSGIVYDDSVIYLIYKIASGVCFVLSAIIFIYVGLYIVKHKEKQSKFRKEISKILKTYDSIIVNSKEKVLLNELNVIKVDEFSELLDAHSEIRQPIIFYENNDCAMFVLINNQTAWQYLMRKTDLYEKKKNKKV